ncbi:MAG: deoxyribose-phosphate aldolase, partial [Humisphaera sp.]|nr:deoxyribose-phosphate aldolase [Humisphaera sp.]
MTPTDLAGKLDHTILKPEALSSEVHRVATEAMQRGSRAVVAAPVWTHRLAQMVQGSGVRVVSTVSFPFGASKSTVKAIEATSTIKDGADEIEVVAHVPPILALDVESARAELMEIVRAARSTRRDVVIRVIVEFEMLMELPPERREPAVETACRAIRESGCDGLVSGTGFHPAGTVSAEALEMVKKYSEGLTIKAAIVDDLESAQGALASGADLIGSEAA